MKNKIDRVFEQDFIRVPRPLIREYGLQAAVMLAEIYSEYTYWRNRHELGKGGWFYSTVENAYRNTGLSKHQQLVACKMLADSGIINIRYCGMPKKIYFKLNMAALSGDLESAPCTALSDYCF